MTKQERDHGGGLDAAVAKFGGNRIGWIDLSTGINPHPYPPQALAHDACTALPDKAAEARLMAAARGFWDVPAEADLLAAPGASALIAQIPRLRPAASVRIPAPTYNEHAAAFEAHGWSIVSKGHSDAQVVVHPNNPDGTRWTAETLPAPEAALTIIDESFCDVTPSETLIALAARPGTLVLKSFGKFWGLAGLRLGFVAGDPQLVSQLRTTLGPWAVSGPALQIGAAALADQRWARQTRARLQQDANRLDHLMTGAGAQLQGGTTLFRLYEVDDAAAWQTRLARHHIWSRIFPYNARWLRLGLPHALHWPRVEAALA
ncbi:threonine-phosphate decarboxylase [Roseobacter cerasinus]|uniref:Aminotransferase n=1 Tax=Roseobacter cerasinus TaxID=2602289 RepID=A0A640VQC6_9RHOB|nr:threonine-phosphate decarboxylase [Roseobacter cerasinus]GFE50443.1 threonine-phosphate decarboxylase [Roseobacter cerasinus]